MTESFINVVSPSVIVEEFDPKYIIRKIERCARTCYKTEDSDAPIGELLDNKLLKATKRGEFITNHKSKEWMDDNDLARELLQDLGIITNPVHASVMDHAFITVKFITNRGMTHELVRHRIGVAFSQESTRYCNYSQAKFGKKVTVIRPYYYAHENKNMIWTQAMNRSAEDYFKLIDAGCIAQEARECLPNSTKTEIVLTANITAWRYILTLRSAMAAHPEIRRSMLPLLEYFKDMMPILFNDIYAKNFRTDSVGMEDVDFEVVPIELF